MRGKLLFITIANTYAGTTNNLAGCDIDAQKITEYADNKEFSNITFKNESFESLNTSLSGIRKLILRHNIDTIVLFFSGHGSFDAKNKIAGIYSNDMTFVPLNTILAYLTGCENVICIFDACQTFGERQAVSRQEINIQNLFILYASDIGETAFDSPSEGGFLVNSVLELFNGYKFDEYFNKYNKNFINTFANRMSLIPTIYSLNIKNRRMCKFNANENFRNKYTKYCDLMKRLTKQSKVNGVTVFNNQVKLNNMPKIKCNNCERLHMFHVQGTEHYYLCVRCAFVLIRKSIDNKYIIFVNEQEMYVSTNTFLAFKNLYDAYLASLNRK